MATCKDTPGTTHHAGCACWEERRDAELAEERAAHARTRAELAAVRERLDSVKGFDMGDGWMICRSANPNTPGWLVSYTEEPGDEDSNVLFVDASGALIEDDLYAFADVLAAFAALAAARKETP